MDEIRNKLRELIKLLRHGNEAYYATQVANALSGTEENLKAFLVSNELWGGAGSMADQALLETEESRKNLEKVLAELGEIQIKHGLLNARTEMWATTFRERQQ